MCAFPHLNGDWACENQDLLIKTLRQRWGFRGLRRERSARNAQHRGIDPRRHDDRARFGAAVLHAPKASKAALAAGEITEADIDQLLRGWYLKMFEFGFFDEPREQLPSDRSRRALGRGAHERRKRASSCSRTNETSCRCNRA